MTFQILRRMATRPEGRPGGTLITTGPDIPGGEMHQDTKMCAHCQANWIVKPGSGKLRGVCMACGGDLCGKPECMDACVPWEEQMDNIERGLPQLHRAVKVHIGQAPPPAHGQHVTEGGIWLPYKPTPE